MITDERVKELADLSRRCARVEGDGIHPKAPDSFRETAEALDELLVLRGPLSAWERFCREHIHPARVFELSQDMAQPTDDERKHLCNCASCRLAYDSYLSTPAVRKLRREITNLEDSLEQSGRKIDTLTRERDDARAAYHILAEAVRTDPLAAIGVIQSL